MKMTNVINAIEDPFDGIVSAFFFEAGELVSDGMLLAEVVAEVEALESTETEESA
ncbi:3-methylcrotonyl-CoA carboxylase [Shewanella pneumatophori]|uniref:3-methylcrotonyl-CoA carboxylase n=1 Tax=Shewanella pneumatophori TaxID=314092 RepID=A0A9X1ZJP4_9GAMM|nr:3-methylcrotonyl-CoA carboxylase [Shewanella pneumatophori]MCL1139018.1 3-methylcrotonyl-CoA carboxylase [Shewanella pneumatophori]